MKIYEGIVTKTTKDDNGKVLNIEILVDKKFPARNDMFAGLKLLEEAKAEGKLEGVPEDDIDVQLRPF